MRQLSQTFRNTLEATQPSDVVLILMDFASGDLDTTVRIANDVVNYTYNGNVYLGYPFQIKLLSDDDKPPKGDLVIQNVTREVGFELQKLVFSPTLRINVFSASDWNMAIDPTSGSRLPIGTPTVEYTAGFLKLWDITVVSSTAQITFGPWDVTSELWPAPRTTKQYCPGLFR